MTHTCSIYILYNKDGVVDYVGRTSRPIQIRIGEHASILGYKPGFEVIDMCSVDCRLVERKWIEHYKQSGLALRNVLYGQGLHCLSEEAKEHLSRINTGIIRSKETRDRMRKAALNRAPRAPFSMEARINISRGKLGISQGPRGAHSEETRTRMSKALIGHSVSEETAKKISVALKGRKVSEEHKSKLREAAIRWRNSQKQAA